MLNSAAILITLAAFFSFLNVRYLRLPRPIGVMVIALLLSLGIVGLGAFGFNGIERYAEFWLSRIDFYDVLMKGMLSLLLFAGALHVNLDELSSRRYAITLLATVSTVISASLIGIAAWAVLNGVGIPISLLYSLIFGALIAPTDPVAVLGILKSAQAPTSLKIIVTGESLFNDGIAVVMFGTLLNIAAGGHDMTATDALLWFARETAGGIVFGVLIGLLAYRMIRSIDDSQVEVLISLALVVGGYTLARHLGVSGPLAMVAAGLLMGKHGRKFAMSNYTQQYVDKFWEMIDEILNVVLFVLIGFEVLALTFTHQYLLAAMLLIPVVLLVRLVCVGIPIQWMRRRLRLDCPHAIKILTWAGVRGGISVALALSLPAVPERQIIVAITYTLVIFSILVQGLTMERVVKAAVRSHKPRQL